MDIRLEGHYEHTLKRITERNREPTAVAMVRRLIRNEAERQGVWETDLTEVGNLDPEPAAEVLQSEPLG